jgi:hypothetical protein
MENLSGYTPTQLLKMSNDIVAKHALIKKEIIDASYQAEELEKSINEKLMLMDELEKNYVTIVEEMNKQNVIQ